MQVLIVDDHPLVLEGLKPVLGKLGSEVSVSGVASVTDARELSSTVRFDLIVLDLKLPGMDGVSGMQVLRECYPEAPIVILSGNYREPDIFAAYRCGAVGFISKSLSSEAMLNAFRLVLSGERYVPGEIVAQLPNERPGSALSEEDETVADPVGDLTSREQDVLSRLFEGLQNKEIARELNIEEITVKLHLTSVYRKLGARNRVHAVRKAYELGLMTAGGLHHRNGGSWTRPGTSRSH